MREAALFDGVDSSGVPAISENWPRVTDPVEQERVSQFLASGTLVLRTTGRGGVDRIAPDRGRKVPLSFATDGEWIWSRSIRYYFVEHQVPLQAEFLAHMRTKGYVAETPTEAQLAQAEAILSGANS